MIKKLILILAQFKRTSSVVTYFRFLQRRFKMSSNENLSSTDRDTNLIDAILEENQDCVDQLIAAGADVNVMDSDDKSALMVAANAGATGSLDSLLKAGADINATWQIYPRGFHTVLDFAAKSGHVECLKLLIKNGVPIDNEAVFLAAANGRTECLEELVKAGVDVNICEGRTWPLECAAGQYTTMELLIRKGADVNMARFGETALHSAASRGKGDCVQLLIKSGADVNLGGDETPLMLAAKQGRVACLRTLIKAGADVHRKDNKGQTALTRALKGNHHECIDLLIEAGANVDNRRVATTSATGTDWLLPIEEDVNREDATGRTALHHAVREGRHLLVVESLIKSGAEVNVLDGFGYTPLLYAVEKDQIDCVSTLISAGADLNISRRSLEQESPLTMASKHGSCKIVKILIDSGADVNQTDSQGNSPLIHAAKEGKNMFTLRLSSADVKQSGNYHTCLELLLKAGADVDMANKYNSTALLLATTRGNIKSMKLLLQADCDINWKDGNGMTALMYVARNREDFGGKPTVSDPSAFMKLLLDVGAHVNIANQNGSTALMEAANSGETVCLEMLMKSGADVNMADRRGLTALIMASNKDTVTTLVQHGAPVNWANDEGLTPLLYVAKNGGGHAGEVAEQLLESGADVNATDVNNTSVISHAASITRRLHDPKIVKTAIKWGAHVNIRNVCGQNSLEYYLAMGMERDEKLALLLFAAGGLLDARNVRRVAYKYEVMHRKLLDRMHPDSHGSPVPVPDCLLEENPIIHLKSFCRRIIRQHLLETDLHVNLFERVPRLGLPTNLQKYLLFETTLNLTDGPFDKFTNEEFQLLGPEQKACRICYKLHQ